MKENHEYRKEAWEALSGNWTTMAIITLVYIVITMAVSGCLSLILGVGTIASWFITFPLMWGFMCLFLKFWRTRQEPQINELFAGFTSEQYLRVMGTTLLQTVYLLLWSLLLIIPGIVKSYSYAFTSFILKDYPELKYNEAIEKSMSMMQGYKKKLFLLDLSFIGWLLLGIITCGIAFLWIEPYWSLARTAFYEDLKEEV